jgi:SAM-dependent methyltransferase
MKLKKKLPPNRSYEQVQNHYLVERALAAKLKESTREERQALFSTMYDELFEKVPDHPRLTIRDSEERVRKSNRSKKAALNRFVDRSTTLLEFAPGSCEFAVEMAKCLEKVYGVDISDQRGATVDRPENFELLIYDGYQLDLHNESVDVVFSDQLIEHLHPDDTPRHFELVKQVLKPGGRYVFRTPHAHNGPHDVSMYFSDEPEGFHLKEWTYSQLVDLLRAQGYTTIECYWEARGVMFRLPIIYFRVVEKLMHLMPVRIRRRLSKYLLPKILAAAVK